MIFQLLLILVVLLFIANSLWRDKKIVNFSKLLQCDLKSLPFIGHSYMFMGNGEQRMKTIKKMGREAIKQDGLSYFWHFNSLYLLIADSAISESVLKHCLEKDDMRKVAEPLIGSSSIISSVEKWRPRRKVMAPVYNSKQLRNYLQAMVRQSEILVDQLKGDGTRTVAMCKYIMRYTMHTVGQTALGTQIKSQFDPNQPVTKAFQELFHTFTIRVLSPWLLNEIIFKTLKPDMYKQNKNNCLILTKFIDEIIKRNHLAIEEKKNTKPDECESNKSMLDLLMQQQNGFDDIELREEILVQFFAGTDTSATGIGFTLVTLAYHPDIQSKVFQELQEVFGESDRSIVAEDLQRVKYLEAVIKETLRLYPPVPLIFRKIDQNHVLPSGLKLVKGTNAAIHIWGIHRNPRYWGSDADVFRPGRFLEGPLKHPEAFQPFSIAPRNCLGYTYAMMSMKVAIINILRRYKVLPTTTGRDVYHHKTQYKPMRTKFDLMIRHSDNFTVQLEQRH